MEMNVETNSSPTAPKPSKQTGWRIWWSLLRPHTLTAAFVPVFIGTAYAMQVGGINQIHLPLFLIMLLACLLIQAATNMFNEYFDYKEDLITKVQLVSAALSFAMAFSQKQCLT